MPSNEAKGDGVGGVLCQPREDLFRACGVTRHRPLQVFGVVGVGPAEWHCQEKSVSGGAGRRVSGDGVSYLVGAVRVLDDRLERGCRCGVVRGKAKERLGITGFVDDVGQGSGRGFALLNRVVVRHPISIGVAGAVRLGV